MTKSHSNPDRIEILNKAGGLIVGDRNQEYGEPYDNMETTINMIKAFIGNRRGSDLTVADAPLLAICLKLARLSGNLGSTDSYTDIIGYSAIAYECYRKDQENKKKGNIDGE